MNYPPVRTAADATAVVDPHEWGEPTKHCDRCGITFTDPGLQCDDCLDVLDMTRPPRITEAPPTPAVSIVVKRDGNRRVNTNTGSIRPDPARSARLREQIPTLRARDMSDVEIALTLGCTDKTVWRIRNELGIPPIGHRRPGDTQLRRTA